LRSDLGLCNFAGEIVLHSVFGTGAPFTLATLVQRRRLLVQDLFFTLNLFCGPYNISSVRTVCAEAAAARVARIAASVIGGRKAVWFLLRADRSKVHAGGNTV
jgi:hypothetical protein